MAPDWLIPKIVRIPLRAARTSLLRLFHPVRRLRAKRRVRALLPVRKIVVLCTGNICRSPYAGHRLAAADGGLSDLQIKSAGLMGSRRKPPEEAIVVARDRGLDLGEHSSVLFSLAMAAWADLTVVMGPAQRSDVVRDFALPRNRILILTDLDPKNVGDRTIFDPLDHPQEVFVNTYERIDRCLVQLEEIVREGQ